MARQQVVTVGPLAAANATLICASQIPQAGTPLTLSGQPDVARRVLVTYGSEAAARTLTISGTNVFGNPIRETLAIPSGAGGTIATQQDFASVTQVLDGGVTWTAAITVGTNAVGSSPWMGLNKEFGQVQYSIAVFVNGTVSGTIEYTYDDPNNSMGTGPAVARPIAAQAPLAAITANADATLNNVAYAWRLTLNSGSGSAQATCIQAGITNLG